VRQRVEGVLRQRGSNFSKEEYDCFLSSLDFNANQQITGKHFRKFL
jgi:hypothetical protein